MPSFMEGIYHGLIIRGWYTFHCHFWYIIALPATQSSQPVNTYNYFCYSKDKHYDTFQNKIYGNFYIKKASTFLAITS